MVKETADCLQNTEIESFMENAYNDKKFNSYTNGPGAALLDEKGNKNRLLLCIKGVPPKIDELSLQRILNNHGNVISVNSSRSEHCTYFFAECATENDFEAVLKGMQNNIFKMLVEPKTDKRRQNNNSNDQENKNDELKSNQLDNREINLSNRTIKGPFTNRQHPKLGDKNKIIDYSNKEYGFNDKILYCQKIENDDNEEKCSPLNVIKTKAKLSEGDYDCKKGAYIKFCNEFSLSKLKLHPCNSCKNPSIKICGKCNEFYCSVECLYQETHQCYFTKLPSNKKMLIESQVLPPINNKPLKGRIPNSGKNVIMTHVEQTNMVYVRSNEQIDNDDYVKVINEVEKCSQNSNNLRKLPNINEYVIAKYNGIWYRAIILNNQSPDEIHIAYIDIGNSEKKKLSELKEFQSKFYNLKYYPFVIYLKNLENSCPNDYFTNYMNEIVNSDTQLKIVYKENDFKDNKIIAELYNVATNENINNKCIELLKPYIPKDSDIPVMFQDIKKEILPNGENISIYIVCNSVIQLGTISCISSYEVDELDKLNDEIMKYAESDNHHYTPREGEMCIAKSESKAWYRAYCYEVVGDGYPTLFFIDYGNMSPVSILNIRKYPKAFTLPCKTDECSIFGLKLDTNQNEVIVARLRELLPLYGMVTVPKVECVDNESILYFPNVIDTLRQEGLLNG